MMILDVANCSSSLLCTVDEAQTPTEFSHNDMNLELYRKQRPSIQYFITGARSESSNRTR